MEKQIEYKFLDNTDYSEIYSAFKLAFADYQVSMDYLTEDILRNRLIKNNVKYDFSVGAFADGQLVGFTLVGIDKRQGQLTAFDASTGIIKEYRGGGVARKMFDFMLPKLKEEKVEKFLLEVLRPNENAIKAYSRAGFSIVRELDCFEFYPAKYKNSNTTDLNIEIKPVSREMIESFRGCLEWEPSWENSLNGIMSIKDGTLSLAAFLNGEAVGMLVYYPGLKWILQLIVKKGHRRCGIGTALLEELIKELPGGTERLCLHNVDESDKGMKKFLLSNGFHEIIGQYEMELNLN